MQADKEKDEIKTSFLSIAPFLFVVFLILPFLIRSPVNVIVPERKGGIIIQKLGVSSLRDLQISEEEQACFRKQLETRKMPVEDDLRKQRLAFKMLLEEIEKSDPLEDLKRSKNDLRNKSRAILKILSRERKLRNGLRLLGDDIRESIRKHQPADSSPFLEILKVCERLLASQEVILQKVKAEYYKDIVENLKTKEALEQQIKLCEKGSGEPRENEREIKKLCLEALQQMEQQER